MAHDPVGDLEVRLVLGEEQCGLFQRLEPSRVDPVGVVAIALAQGLRNGRADSGVLGGCQFAFDPILRDPLRNEPERFLFLIRSEQGAKILMIGSGRRGFLFHPLGQYVGQFGVAALRAEHVGVGVPERIALVLMPLGVLAMDRAEQPGIGRVVVTQLDQQAGVLLLERVVAGIILRKLLPQPQHFVAPAGPCERIDPLPEPPLHGVELRFLPPIDGPKDLQQPERLVGLEDPLRLAAKVIGQEEIVVSEPAGILRLDQLDGLLGEQPLELFPIAPIAEDRIAEPSKPRLVAQLGQMLVDLLPTLGHREVEHHGHMVVERGLTVLHGPFGVQQRHHGLVKELNVVLVGQLAVELLGERVVRKRLECLGNDRIASAFRVEALDSLGPPSAGHLDELGKLRARRDLVVLVVVELQDHMPPDVDQHADLEALATWMGQHQQPLVSALRPNFGRIALIGSFDRPQHVEGEP